MHVTSLPVSIRMLTGIFSNFAGMLGHLHIFIEIVAGSRSKSSRMSQKTEFKFKFSSKNSKMFASNKMSLQDLLFLTTKFKFSVAPHESVTVCDATRSSFPDELVCQGSFVCLNYHYYNYYYYYSFCCWN